MKLTRARGRVGPKRVKASYRKRFQSKVRKVMHEWKAGKLKTSYGVPVDRKDQAIAIALSEARKKVKKK